MSEYLFEVEDQSLPRFRVIRLGGYEGISQLFRFEVTLLCSEPDVDFSKLLNKQAALKIYCWQTKDYSRVFHGIISRFEEVGRHFIAPEGVVFHAELVPRLWRLMLISQCRIFQNLSVPEIIEEVLKAAGFQQSDYELSLQRNYEPRNQPPREFCVQYNETDFQFISRLMEEEGIFYFFRHNTDKEVLVIADSPAVHRETTPLSRVEYDPTVDRDTPREEWVPRLEYTERVVSTKVTLKDFNYQTPRTELMTHHFTARNESFSVFEYPGGFGSLERGDSLARIRNEAMECGRMCIEGESNCRSLAAGFRFTLSGHSQKRLNQEYLLTHVVHELGEKEVRLPNGRVDQKVAYSNRFVCIPANIPYRPTQLTPKPKIYGTQTAIVTGVSDEEIHVDEQQLRVKLQFHWDVRPGSEKNSCWVRVGQVWAGSGFGSTFIPRVDQEVIVSFLEGDPDRPIIIGCVYNGANSPPYSLPQEKTKTGIKSNSYPGGGGSNEIWFDDRKDSEEIYLHAQKNWTIEIENDKNQTVGHDETFSVGNNRTKHVEVDQKETIGHDKTIEVGNDHDETIGHNMTINVGQNLSETIGSNMTLQVSQNLDETIGNSMTLQVAQNINENVGGNHSEQVQNSFSLKAQRITLQADDQIVLKTGSAQIVMRSNGDVQIKGNNIQLKGSGNIIIKGNKIAEN